MNQGALGSSTRFLGYADAILDGGDGSNGGGDGGDIEFQPDMESTTGGHGLYVYTNVTATGGDASADNGGDGGDISFGPQLDFVVRGSAPAENVVVVGNIDLSGGDGDGNGGAGGSIYTDSDCAPILSTTGVRVEGTITQDGGDSGTASGGRTGGLYLATARGAAVVAGSVVEPHKRRFRSHRAEYVERGMKLLKTVGLHDFADKYPWQLSGGMQKRAGIARAIAMDPQILLFDDPTAGLDPVLTDAIAELIKGIKRNLGSTAIVVAHDFNLAYKLADRIGLMVGGRLHGILSRDEFRTSAEAYFEQFREGKLTGPIPVVE